MLLHCLQGQVLRLWLSLQKRVVGHLLGHHVRQQGLLQGGEALLAFLLLGLIGVRTVRMICFTCS